MHYLLGLLTCWQFQGKLLFEKFDLHESFFVFVHSEIELHFEVIEAAVKIVGYFINRFVAILLRFFILLSHSITP